MELDFVQCFAHYSTAPLDKNRTAMIELATVCRKKRKSNHVYCNPDVADLHQTFTPQCYILICFTS